MINKKHDLINKEFIDKWLEIKNLIDLIDGNETTSDNKELADLLVKKADEFSMECRMYRNSLKNVEEKVKGSACDQEFIFWGDDMNEKFKF